MRNILRICCIKPKSWWVCTLSKLTSSLDYCGRPTGSDNTSDWEWPQLVISSYKQKPNNFNILLYLLLFWAILKNKEISLDFKIKNISDHRLILGVKLMRYQTSIEIFLFPVLSL